MLNGSRCQTRDVSQDSFSEVCCEGGLCLSLSYVRFIICEDGFFLFQISVFFAPSSCWGEYSHKYTTIPYCNHVVWLIHNYISVILTRGVRNIQAGVQNHQVQEIGHSTSFNSQLQWNHHHPMSQTENRAHDFPANTSHNYHCIPLYTMQVG